jgi:hypothetical protein
MSDKISAGAGAGGKDESVATLTAELERVRIERDEARAQLAVASGAPRPSRHRVRKVTAVVLVVVSCLSFLTGGIGIWASRNFLDTDVWVQRTGPLIENPAVQSVVSTKMTDAVMELVKPEALFKEVLPERGQLLAVPLASAVRSFVGSQVAKVVDTDAFARLWVAVNRQAHAAAVKVLKGDSEAVTAGDKTVTLNLIPVINRVLAQITSVSPEIFGRTVNIPDIRIDEVPSAAIRTINQRFGTNLPRNFGQIRIYDQGKLKELQDAVKTFDRVVWLSIVLFVASTIGALALSVDRRRTLLQLSIADVLLMVLMRRGAVLAQQQIASLVKVPANRPAVKAVTAAMFEGMFDVTRILLWLLGIVIVVAVVAGPGRREKAFRSWVSSAAVGVFTAARDRGTDPATTVWIVAHRDLLQVGGAALAVAALWALNLSWIGVLVVLVLTAIYIGLLARLPSPESDADSDAAPPPLGGPLPGAGAAT